MSQFLVAVTIASKSRMHAEVCVSAFPRLAIIRTLAASCGALLSGPQTLA